MAPAVIPATTAKNVGLFYPTPGTSEDVRFGILGRVSVGDQDVLDFIEVFNYPPIDSIEDSLDTSPRYTKEQKTEILAGLKTLAGYNRD